MARPTKAATLEAAAKKAEEAIKASLPEIVNVLIETAVAADKTINCPKCSHKIILKSKGDPRIGLSLLERVAGKPTEAKPQGPAEQLSDLFKALAAEGSTAVAAGAPTVSIAVEPEEETPAIDKDAARRALKIASGEEDE